MSDKLLDGNFTWHTSDENTITDYAKENGIIIDWNLLNKDDTIIEYNLLKFMNKSLDFVQDEGHDDYSLVGSIGLKRDKVPLILIPNSQDNVNYYNDTNTIMVFHLNEWVQKYSKELLVGTVTDYAYLLLETASLVLSVDYPTKVYFDILL